MENPTTQTYYISETRRCYQVWEYTVEATSQEEALQKVKNGEVEADFHEFQDDATFEPEFEFE
jgi:hypothetical protein